MVRRVFAGAALALTLSLGVWSGPSRAQEVVTEEEEAPPPAVHHKKPKASHPFLTWMVQHPPWGCWTTINEYSCSNLRSEYIFLFGSCCSFYGEPCVKGPPIPPSPVYPSLQTAPGYPGHWGYEGHPNYPFRPSPPGYPFQPWYVGYPGQPGYPGYPPPTYYPNGLGSGPGSGPVSGCNCAEP